VNPLNFFAELKRGNVYKVAIAYAVVAWLLMQIATQVFPFLEIPKLGDPVGDNAARVRISDRADARLGIRAHSGRNQTDRSNRTWAAIAKSRMDLRGGPTPNFE
jgi:hypothetical protein